MSLNRDLILVLRYFDLTLLNLVEFDFPHQITDAPIIDVPYATGANQRFLYHVVRLDMQRSND